MGGSALAKLRVELGLTDKSFSAGLGKAEKQARGFGQTMKAVFAIAGGFLLAQTVMRIGQAFGGAIGGAFNFGKEMANVNSIAKLSDQQLSQLSDSVIAIAKDPRISQAPDVLAAGLYNIYSSGFAGADGLTILQKAAFAATAGLTTTDTAAQVGTATLNAYGMQADQTGRVFDVLFQTVNDGVITFDQLANNMGNTLPVAASLGISIEELGAAYAQMTLKGVGASQAETQIASLMRSALNPTDALTQAVQSYGYESAEALIRTEGLTGFLKLLRQASGGSQTELMNLLGTQEAMNAATILGANNVGDYVTELDRMKHASDGVGATQAALARQMKSASYQFGQIKKNAQILATTLFRFVEPALAQIARSFAKALLVATSFVLFFAEIIRGAKTVTTSFGAMGTGVTTIGKNIDDALAAIPKPLRGVALAIAGVIDTVKLWAGSLIEAFRSGMKVSDLTAALPKSLQGLAKGFLTVVDAAGDLVARLRSKGLSGALQILPRELSQALDGLKEIGNAILGFGVDLANWVIHVGAPKVVAWTKDLAGWLWDHLRAGWDLTIRAGTFYLNAQLKLAGMLFDLSRNAGAWIVTQVRTNWDGAVHLGQVTIDATFTLATGIDWSGIGRAIITGLVGAVRNAVVTFSPLDMFKFTYAFGQALGPAITDAVTAAFDAFKADPVGSALLALKIALAIAAIFLSPLILAAVLTGALAVWVGAGIIGLASGIVGGALGIDFEGVASAIADGIVDAVHAITGLARRLAMAIADKLGIDNSQEAGSIITLALSKAIGKLDVVLQPWKLDVPTPSLGKFPSIADISKVVDAGLAHLGKLTNLWPNKFDLDVSIPTRGKFPSYTDIWTVVKSGLTALGKLTELWPNAFALDVSIPVLGKFPSWSDIFNIVYAGLDLMPSLSVPWPNPFSVSFFSFDVSLPSWNDIWNAVWSGLSSLPGINIDWPNPFKINFPGFSTGGVIPAFASGGVLQSRLAIVGERGPELAALPVGTRVFTAADTTRMLRDASSQSGGNGGTVVNNTFAAGSVVFPNATNSDEIQSAFNQLALKTSRTVGV